MKILGKYQNLNLEWTISCLGTLATCSAAEVGTQNVSYGRGEVTISAN